MSKPLFVGDLVANNDINSAFTILPPFNSQFDFDMFDSMEYLLGMKRGDLYLLPLSKMRWDARTKLAEAFYNGLWILVPERKILTHLENTLGQIDTFDDRVDALKAATYNYTLYYLEDKVTITDLKGNKCNAGSTVVTSTLHPFFMIPAANRFFLGRRPYHSGAAHTGFQLDNKSEWRPCAHQVFIVASSLIVCCPYSFYATNRRLDSVRPRPGYFLDDSEEARIKNEIVEQPWCYIKPAEEKTKPTEEETDGVEEEEETE